MKKNTSENWEEEFDKKHYGWKNTKFDMITGEVEYEKDKDADGIVVSKKEVKDFIRKTRQEAKQETIKEIKEWAMEYKYARHNPDKDCDCETCMFVKNLLSKLNSI